MLPLNEPNEPVAEVTPRAAELETAVDSDLEMAAVQRPPFAFAKRHGILVDDIGHDRALLRCRENVTAQALAETRRFLGLPLKVEALIDAEDFDTLIQKSYASDGSNTMQSMGDLGDELDLSSIAQALPEPEDLLETQDDAPIIRLINALLTEAIKENASDIHIEPYENRMVVRFRVDGVLREVLEPARVIAPLLVSRVKVMAKLDIAEKRLPQDGRISLKVAGRAVDVRVSTLSSGHGERVVLRLLDKQAGRLDLDHIGMEPGERKIMDGIIHKPHGIILVTGPTGSGKTTTLYAVLSRLNNKDRNIMTFEDPVEYYLDGVSQTQVQAKVDMSFSRGLRAILRQDPDVVMVGEIRDLETAEIAVQASLTGHLVLSTLHTNTAIGSVTRLRDMGIEPFLLASSLIGVLAQRLVRKLCPDCKHPHLAGKTDCERLGVSHKSPPTIYTPDGCKKCNFNGYKGRMGIFELIDVDETLRTMIHDGSAEQQLEQQARTRTHSIFQDGIRRVLTGETSLEEVLRVTYEE